MNRPVLDQVSTEALNAISTFHQDVVKEVSQAVSKNKVVVVGMSLNGFVKKAKKALTNAGVEFTYLEYGGYCSKWKERLAIKLWSGWPTYPQVFVNGKLIGGAKETVEAIKKGSLTK
jgi:glutaredoxin-related protein